MSDDKNLLLNADFADDTVWINLSGWRNDMENAPRDGTRFLGYWPSPDGLGGDAPAEIRTWWDVEGGYWNNPYECEDDHNRVTHWMPLPPPPVSP